MLRPDRPGPLRRRGPRPLLMHLLPSSTARPTDPPRISAQRPPTIPSGLDPALIAGIAAYRRHPWQRDLADPPSIWREGGSTLFDYGSAADPAVLFVPSLINRAYVLDVAPGQSMMRWLAGQGVRPLLLDWGWPGPLERTFSLTDYIAGRLERALLAVEQPVVLAGYCMGGLLTLAAALRRPDCVRALALLATPWDFHAVDADQAERLAKALPVFEPLLAAAGALPTDILQALFAVPDPRSIAAKYRAFGRMDQASPAALCFVALEDWLNDGVPLAAPVAREALAGWYGANSTGRGAWRVAGQAVDPCELAMPSFVAAPGRDRIVPPESALPLARLIPGAVLHQPAAGHIGMAAGPRAQSVLWEPFLGWLRGLG
jgi:polyhydroxyalkanoate synthase subunit PhaC